MAEIIRLPLPKSCNAAFNFFLLAGVERTGVRAAGNSPQTRPVDRHRAASWLPHFGQVKPLLVHSISPVKAALIALIDRRVGTVVGDMCW